MNPSSHSPSGVSAGTGEQQPAASEKRSLRGSEVAYAVFAFAVAILLFATAF